MVGMPSAPVSAAVIDIGTNSARMEIAQLRPDGSVVVTGDEKVAIRLGESVFREGGISGQAFDRALAAIRQLFSAAQTQGIERIRAVATSALREADNGREFADRVESDLGVHVEIISGNEEARLIHLGACEDYPGRESLGVLDIGGGSTEIAIGRGASLWMTSLRAGSARLTEYFLHSDPPRAGELRTLETFLENAVQSRWRDVPEAAVFVGTAGTNGAIAEVLTRDGKAYNLESVAALLDKLARLDVESRRKLLGPKEAPRADIIVAGLAVAKAFLKVTGVKEIKPSSRGLRDGLLVEESIRAGFRPAEWGDARTLRRVKLIQLGDLYRFDRLHAEHTAKLAGMLFDSLTDVHKFGDEERDLMEAAALLHDIGHHISYSRHHKHTYYLIKNSDLPGFDEHEVELIANIARYHRKALPSDKHQPFKEMSKEDRRKVQLLGGIVRMADACDRRHVQAVQGIKARVSDDKIAVKLTAADTAEVEKWLIEERAADLFEAAFRKKVTVEVRPPKAT
jgi:exopolyphosphatase/guanosine-5'-triphosphate,3'-diphosphate pyrophosphatase